MDFTNFGHVTLRIHYTPEFWQSRKVNYIVDHHYEDEHDNLS